ncbi:DUF983 domain-containing protein [Parachryseolinea silvisoli]|jgi:uncharacterized protein (DUF983 family)|uniref:DUF983 domain-containing protein n=1 Tax=Parachryseolinea silvisoli TaxID=2873601 RepID=UPI002265BEC2|nr:DUF983 domain-containing protein [Parachryseolinea silvisoli]MCD9017463.1 DUF983 domain-containing protein [Parachryseolinea silvisoli]
MAEKSSLTALLQGNCPRCREGKIFTWSILEKPGKFNAMNEFCPHCGVRLEPEPGFYQGAMYVGYGFTVGLLVAFSIIFFLFFPDKSEWFHIGVFVGVMVLFIPLNYRYSRILYLYLFGGIGYDPSKK